MNDADELAALADGELDLIVLSNGVTMQTHGPDVCLGPSCCIHRPSAHPLRAAPMIWLDEVRVMMRVCEHEQPHPDPDSMGFRFVLTLATGLQFYDGWHPCCPSRCCQVGGEGGNDD